MAASLQPCGCVFDSELVDSVHQSEGQTHKPKGKTVVDIPPPPAGEDKVSFLEKVLPKSKKSKDGD